MAGVEQLVLRGFGAAGSAAAADNALLALAGLPATLGAVRGALGTHLQDPEFASSVVHAVDSTLDHARTTLLPDLDPEGGMHLGLFFDTAAAAAGQGPWGALRAGAKWGGKEILHGLEDLGRQVVQSEGVARTLADAVEQLEQTGEAIVDLLDLDGTFGGGVPVVTLVISLSRETRLLRAGRTTSRAAARNLILDLTGTGVGGMLGLAIGGLAGSLVAPGPGSAAGAMAGAPAGAATGRTITNKIKTRRVRRARDELAQLEKAVPGRVQEAEHQLADAVAGQASVSREAYRAAAGPPPRLDVGRGSPVAAVAAELRSATTAYLREVDAAVARAKDAAAGGYIPSPAVVATTARLDIARRAVAATAGAAPLRALCALAEAAPPVPAGRRLGSGYRTATLAAANRLGEVAGVHATQVRTWSGRPPQASPPRRSTSPEPSRPTWNAPGTDGRDRRAAGGGGREGRAGARAAREGGPLRSRHAGSRLRSTRDTPSAAVRTAGASRSGSSRLIHPVIEMAATAVPSAPSTGAATQVTPTPTPRVRATPRTRGSRPARWSAGPAR